MSRFSLVGYQTPKQSLREKDSPKSFPVDIHRIRDTTMSVTLASRLASKGYQFGGQILNLPSDKPIVNERPSSPPIAPGDVLVLPTRPPLGDADSGPRRREDHSGHDLEQSLFSSLRMAFADLNRGSVLLSEGIMEAISRPSMGSEVSEDAAQYESLKINKYGDAAEVTSLSGPGRNGKTDFLLPTRLPVAIMPSPAVALRPCRSAIVDGKILERASQACLRENS